VSTELVLVLLKALETGNDIVEVRLTILDRFSHHFQTHIVLRVSDDMPFDKLYGHFFDFDTGHGAGMNAAPAVEVVGFFRLSCQTLLLAQGQKHRAMGVARDSNHVSLSGPFYDACFHLVAFSDLLSRACRVSQTEDVLEGSPDMAHPKSAKRDKCIIDEVTLVAVKQENLFSKHGCFENLDAGKKVWDEYLNFLERFLHPPLVYHLQVVVPCDITQPVVFMELVHLAENISMGPCDICQIPVFIQLVPVTEFDIREVAGVIIIQRTRKNEGIVHEIIGPVPDSSVEVAENHDFGFRCQVKFLLVVLESLIQSWLDP
jgi:hypothetical protein